MNLHGAQGTAMWYFVISFLDDMQDDMFLVNRVTPSSPRGEAPSGTQISTESPAMMRSSPRAGITVSKLMTETWPIRFAERTSEVPLPGALMAERGPDVTVLLQE